MTFDGHPSVGVAIFQLPGTNALDVAEQVQKKMRQLAKRFPDGVDYQIAYDTTPFIRESVADVFQTLLVAAVLVGLVVLVFLQNWRSVLIPMIAMPVAIIGTFAVMAAVGFSLNNISLFGLVLAIGIVVDDAIVVVENVERWLDKGVAPREATYKAMDEVTGPVIAVALVLCAVFVPCAFISGITGRFFRQFAVTIAASTVFSAINSLTLSPALAAILLRPRHGVRRDPLTWLLNLALGWFFRLFNAVFGASTAGYAWIVGRLLRVNVLVLAGLRRLAGSDLYDIQNGAAGVRAATRPRPNHRQRATARRGVAGTHKGRLGEDRRDRPQRQGRGAHAHRGRFLLRAGRQRLEFRLDVHHPRPVRRAERSGPDRHGHHGQIAAAVEQAGQRRAGVRLPGAADPRAERGRRIQAHGRGSRRPGPADPGSTDRQPGSGTEEAARADRMPPRSSAPPRRSSTWTSTGPRSRRWEYR